MTPQSFDPPLPPAGATTTGRPGSSARHPRYRNLENAPQRGANGIRLSAVRDFDVGRCAGSRNIAPIALESPPAIFPYPIEADARRNRRHIGNAGHTGTRNRPAQPIPPSRGTAGSRLEQPAGPIIMEGLEALEGLSRPLSVNCQSYSLPDSFLDRNETNPPKPPNPPANPTPAALQTDPAATP
jgi:hypothetical protein